MPLLFYNNQYLRKQDRVIKVVYSLYKVVSVRLLKTNDIILDKKLKTTYISFKDKHY